MRNLKSMLLTLLCALIILSLGYLGIVGQGKQILRSESVPEKAEYENVGSNIFYGKIEDDIEIFPWNYYPENPVREEVFPNFIMEEATSGAVMFEEEEMAQVDRIISEGNGEVTDLQAQCYVAADKYFGAMIAHEAGVGDEEVLEYFRKPGNHIVQNMVFSTDSYIESLCFYQNTLTLGGKKYQVRIACSDWNVINFICVEYSAEDKREREEWKKGKEQMVAVLEQSGEPLSKYFTYMSHLSDLGAPTIYVLEEEYNNAFLSGFYYLEYITSGMKLQNEEAIFAEKKMNMVMEEWNGLYRSEYDTDLLENDAANAQEKDSQEDTQQEEQEIEYAVDYSYQIVELKDTILLLVQGDFTMGLYYDPMNQKFCGYNFLYEY